MAITLRQITRANFNECLALQVHDAQKGFVATNVCSLAQAWLYPQTARPFAIYHDEIMVGFVMLDVISDKPKCELWRFMIDRRFQGMGYGKEALSVILSYIKEQTHCETVRLSFEPENTVAETLYTSKGFERTGEMDDGEAVMSLNLRA